MSKFKFIDKFAARFGIDTDKLSWKTKRRAVEMERDIEEGEKRFSEAFGMDFESAVVNVLQRRMPALLPLMLPDILFQLAYGDESVNTSDKPFVACLHKVGAFWGEAPAGEAADRSTAAFHLFVERDTEPNPPVYRLSMIPGTAQVVGYNVSALLELGSGYSFQETSPVSCWFYLKWTQSSDTWQAVPVVGAVDANTPSPSNCDLYVPIFKFWIDENKNAHVSQLVEGAVYLTWTVNALDVDSSS